MTNGRLRKESNSHRNMMKICSGKSKKARFIFISDEQLRRILTNSCELAKFSANFQHCRPTVDHPQHNVYVYPRVGSRRLRLKAKMTQSLDHQPTSLLLRRPFQYFLIVKMPFCRWYLRDYAVPWPWKLIKMRAFCLLLISIKAFADSQG